MTVCFFAKYQVINNFKFSNINSTQSKDTESELGFQHQSASNTIQHFRASCTCVNITKYRFFSIRFSLCKFYFMDVLHNFGQYSGEEIEMPTWQWRVTGLSVLWSGETLYNGRDMIWDWDQYYTASYENFHRAFLLLSFIYHENLHHATRKCIITSWVKRLYITIKFLYHENVNKTIACVGKVWRVRARVAEVGVVSLHSDGPSWWWWVNGIYGVGWSWWWW